MEYRKVTTEIIFFPNLILNDYLRLQHNRMQIASYFMCFFKFNLNTDHCTELFKQTQYVPFSQAFNNVTVRA